MTSSASSYPPDLPAQPSPPTVELGAGPVLGRPGVDVVAVPVLARSAPAGSAAADAGISLGPGAAEVGEALGLDLLGLAEAARATGETGQVVEVPVTHPQHVDLRSVLLVGVGEGSPTQLRRASAAAARAAAGRALLVTTLAGLDTGDGLDAVAVGSVLGAYAFTWRSRPLVRPPVAHVTVAGVPAVTDDDRSRLARATAVAGAAWRSRMLASVPSNLKNPPWLADRALDLAREAGLEARVWDEEQLAAEGFGGILAVGRGSDTPPRLVRLDYTPPSDAAQRGLRGRRGRRTSGPPTVVLVGKGITFDSGGYSIKPAQAMATMKRDMTGGAVVLSTMAALAAVGCPVRVVGLVAMAENAVSGRATRPGDVVRHWGGRTSEVTNTDAEGRLVMADALAYAVSEIAPAAVVDVATLTGAVKVALGQQVGGLFADHDVLADTLLAAGEASGEPLWRLPLAAAYEDKIASKVADADNAGGGPGAVTAALFLQHFTGDVPWAHLDLASVGEAPEERFEWTEGPTGFGARALLTWLGSDDPLAGVV